MTDVPQVLAPEQRRVILLELFKNLREEIKQSIDKQHFILIGGYSATTILFSKTDHLYVVPGVLLTMTALWGVEVNRMVRCGYYIAYEVWPELRDCDAYLSCLDRPGGKQFNWELWVREGEGKNAAFFRNWQHRLQRIVILILPVVLSTTAFIHTWKMPDAELPIGSRTAFTMYVGLVVFGWAHVWWGVRRVSHLGAIVPMRRPGRFQEVVERTRTSLSSAARRRWRLMWHRK